MTSITHATVATGTNAGTGEIHKAEWNADHTVSLAAGKVFQTADFTTSSTSFVDVTSCAVTITTGAHRCLMMFSNAGGVTSGTIYVGLSIDGTDVESGYALVAENVSGVNDVPLSYTYLTDVLSAA